MFDSIYAYLVGGDQSDKKQQFQLIYSRELIVFAKIKTKGVKSVFENSNVDILSSIKTTKDKSEGGQGA